MAELTLEIFNKALKKGFDDMAIIVAKGFDNTATKEDIKRLEGRIDSLEARIVKLEQQIEALSNKLTNYMELSDKRYLELKHRDLLIAKWLQQIADKTGVVIDLKELEQL